MTMDARHWFFHNCAAYFVGARCLKNSVAVFWCWWVEWCHGNQQVMMQITITFYTSQESVDSFLIAENVPHCREYSNVSWLEHHTAHLEDADCVDSNWQTVFEDSQGLESLCAYNHFVMYSQQTRLARISRFRLGIWRHNRQNWQEMTCLEAKNWNWTCNFMPPKLEKVRWNICMGLFIPKSWLIIILFSKTDVSVAKAESLILIQGMMLKLRIKGWKALCSCCFSTHWSARLSAFQQQLNNMSPILFVNPLLPIFHRCDMQTHNMKKLVVIQWISTHNQQS